MLRNTAFSCLTVGLLAIIGCNSNPTQPDLEPEIVQDDTEAGLESYRSRWNASGVSSYHLGVFQRCVCVQNLILYNVVVEDGVPISATKTSSTVENEPVPVEDVPYPTIDALFDLIQLGFDQEVRDDQIESRLTSFAA